MITVRIPDTLGAFVNGISIEKKKLYRLAISRRTTSCSMTSRQQIILEEKEIISENKKLNSQKVSLLRFHKPAFKAKEIHLGA